MVQNYTVWVENNAYPVVVSDEREALLAAKAVGRVFVALYTENPEQETLWDAGYLAAPDAICPEYLERIVRRHIGLPWIIAETDRLIIREFTLDDIAQMPEEPDVWYTEEERTADRVFYDKDKLESYIKSQYHFYEYGIWAVVEKESMTVIGKAGLFQPTAEFLNVEIQQTEFRQAEIQQTESQQAEASPPQKKEDTPLELGYHIFTPWRRSGYAKEACREILNYGTGRLTGCICAVIEEGNTASIRLAESLGFRLTAQRYIESAGLLYLYEASCS